MSTKKRELSERQATDQPDHGWEHVENQENDPKDDRKRETEGIVELPRPAGS